MPPKKSIRGNPPPPLTHDTVNRMIQESVEAAIRAERERERERERVQNEANHAEGPNIALVAWECTFADFMKCNPITFRGNERVVGFDPQLLVEHFNPVGDNTSVLESDVVDDSACLMLLEDVR
nr:hypothetical protein [Tanacetum cinerariifolium]